MFEPDAGGGGEGYTINPNIHTRTFKGEMVLKGVNSPFLRVEVAPLGRCWYIYVYIYILYMYTI